jgi:hypothetical protein
MAHAAHETVLGALKGRYAAAHHFSYQPRYLPRHERPDGPDDEASADL